MKKNFTYIIMFMLIFMIFQNMFSKKNKMPEIVTLKSGIYYEMIATEGSRANKGFFSRLFSRSKELKYDNVALVDMVEVSIDNNKFTSINLINLDKLKEKEAELTAIVNEIATTGNVNNINLPKEIEKEGRNVISAISKAVEKSTNDSKQKSNKVRPGTYSVIKKYNDSYMLISLVTDSTKFESVNVSYNNLTSEEEIIIQNVIKDIMENRKIVDNSENLDGVYGVFNEGIKDILADAGSINIERIEMSRSNIVWQSIKDAIAWTIRTINKGVNNYGLSIILATILLKILMLPLTLKQDKSMRMMRSLQPEIDKIKEKYKNNMQLQQQKTMELYKEKKINPMGGCFPLLIQMPILIALFGVLRSGFIPETGNIANIVVSSGDASVNILNGFLTGPKFLWMDLVNYDPIYLLPILTTVVTYFQQKLIGGMGDNPMMKNMNIIMPLMMGWISLKMPAGVQIYWLLSTVLGVLQQCLIMKRSK